MTRRLGKLPSRLTPATPRTATPARNAGSGFARTDGLSAAARGYDGRWRRLRLQILAAEPLCRFCAASGRVTAASHVDHIEPFHGLHDPRRLDPANLRPLCQPCHMAHTARQANGER